MDYATTRRMVRPKKAVGCAIPRSRFNAFRNMRKIKFESGGAHAEFRIALRFFGCPTLPARRGKPSNLDAKGVCFRIPYNLKLRPIPLEEFTRELSPPGGSLICTSSLMFESVSFARDGIIGGSVAFGQLAEALVFYQEVHFLADQETFAALVRTCGADVVLELCQMGNLKIHKGPLPTSIRSIAVRFRE